VEIAVTNDDGFPASEIAKLATLSLAVVGSIVVLVVFWIAPWMHAHHARAHTHEALQIAAIHKLGFSRITQDDIQNDGWTNYFVYQVGSCPTTVYVEHPLNNYRSFNAFIWLSGVRGTQVNVTLHSLKHLPQMASCFVK
jgi:hypothetical protein